MTIARLLASSLIMMALPAAAHAPARHAAAAARDWTRVTMQTPEGGTRIGNPAARVVLVEYGSFTCPHCAAFAKEAFDPIVQRYVRGGRLSFEFRPALRDGGDMVAALTARCGGPARFFPTAEAIFAAQTDWERRASEWQDKTPPDPKADVGATMTAMARASGLAAIAAGHGIPAAALERCLADTASLNALAETAHQAWDVRQIGGTPAFYLNNDKLADVYGWAALEPYLRAALKG